jgi:cholesterol transport system auxiliary component
MIPLRAIHPRAIHRTLAAMSLAGLLSGCISVLPKEPPAQLYRFGDPGPNAPAATAPTPPSFTVEALPITFDRPAAGDAILTLTGNQAAYIKGSRWVGPAQTLFESAVTRTFESSGGAARLMVRGEPSRPDYLLKLDVLRFEAHYDQGQGAPPAIVVEVNATLSHSSDHALAGERLFQVKVTTDANRAGAITAGYDQATRKVLTDLVAWVDAKGGSPQ